MLLFTLFFTLSFTPPLPVPCNTVPSREPRPLSLLCVFSPYGLWSSRPTSSPPNWLAFCFASFLLLYTVFVGTVERQRTKRVEWCTTGLWSRTSLSVAWELSRERMPRQLADRRIHAGISRKLLPGPCKQEQEQEQEQERAGDLGQRFHFLIDEQLTHSAR